MREMVEVILYKDGMYEVHDVESDHRTQRMWVSYNGKEGESYYCLKDKWKHYLIKLCSTKDIDKKIDELKKNKKRIEDIKTRILAEIKSEENNENN